jgi:hypothetical protein
MVQHTCWMNNDFKVLLRLFFDLCLIQKGPRDVPDSSVLLKFVFCLYFLAGSVLLSSSLTLSEALMQSFIETLLLGVFVYLLVNFFAVKNRFNQSITAVYGSGALMTIVSVPFIFWTASLVDNNSPTGVVGLIVFLIVCWSFIVMANIIRETIQKSFSVSLLLTFCYLYVSYQLITKVFPSEITQIN